MTLVVRFWAASRLYSPRPRSVGMKSSIHGHIMRARVRKGEASDLKQLAGSFAGSGRACVRACARAARTLVIASFFSEVGRQQLKGFPQKVLPPPWPLRLPATAGPDLSWCVSSLRSGGGPTPKGGSPSPPSTSTRGFEVPHRQHFNAVPGYSWLCGMDHTRVMTTLLRGSGLSTHHGSV